MMLKKPYVGQKVKLSKSGFARLKLESEKAFKDAKNMTITVAQFIGSRELGEAGNVWHVEVDKPKINQYALTIADLKEIKPKCSSGFNQSSSFNGSKDNNEFEDSGDNSSFSWQSVNVKSLHSWSDNNH